MAAIYENLGNNREAEILYNRALGINEKIFGKFHPKVAMNLDNLAVLYYNKEIFGEATENIQIEPFIKRALEIREKIFGSNHPDVALSLNNLSSLYNVQGKHQESLKLLQRSLAIYEKAYGTKHTQVAIQYCSVKEKEGVRSRKICSRIYCENNKKLRDLLFLFETVV